MTPEAKEILKSSEARITQQNALKLSKLAPDQQEEAATLLTTGQIRPVDEYHTEGAPEPPRLREEKLLETTSQPRHRKPESSEPLSKAERAKFKAIIADLKNHDKDCSATPASFMMEYGAFIAQFTHYIH